MRWRREPGPWLVLAGITAVLCLLTAGCGEDGGEAQERGPAAEDPGRAGPAADCDVTSEASADPATSSVQVSLTEYGIAANPQQVPAGPVEFTAANQGRIWHELMVVRYDGDPGGLPRDAFGGVDETRLPEGAVVGKILEFLAGASCSATFDLDPGHYALICNLVDDGSNPHYSQGMYTAFTVT